VKIGVGARFGHLAPAPIFTALLRLSPYLRAERLAGRDNDLRDAARRASRFKTLRRVWGRLADGLFRRTCGFFS
jgi:hypothetical protein